MRRLYLKSEGATPTGNHKFALAETACAAFMRGPWSGIAVASCGHLGISLAVLCSCKRVPCRVFVVRGSPFNFALPGVAVEDQHRTYEAAVAACTRWAAKQGWLDATPGAQLASEYIATYALLAREIVEALGQLPSAVICPAGNGTTLSGVHSGFERLGVGAVPRHYGATSRENLFVSGGISTDGAEDWATEPLRSALPLDMDMALRAVHTSGGRFLSVSREALVRSAGCIAEDESLDCHPASGAVVAALEVLRAEGEIAADDLVVAILTTQHAR